MRSLTRLLDPDAASRGRVPEFVGRGDFGLGSGRRADGGFERLWYSELVGPEEVAFDGGVFLLTKARAKALKAARKPEPEVSPVTGLEPETVADPVFELKPEAVADSRTTTLRLSGSIPPEVWNRLGTKVIPKLRTGR